MTRASPRPFGSQLKSLREAAGFTQEELATIAGLSVHAVSALERGERRHPHFDTVRALSAALDLTAPVRDAFVASSRSVAADAALDELRAQPLPYPIGAFVDREDDMRLLREWFADPTARLITLIGPGGVGKSRLALELAHGIADETSSLVVFVPLAAIRDQRLVGSAIAEALGLADLSAAELPRRTRAACADRPVVLVLDNFEQVLDAATLVANLLTAAPSLRLLVTSRTPLHLRGEREYLVGPLAVPIADEALAPLDLNQAPAVRLFVERARDVQHDFDVTPANGPTLAAICRRLDALPLALELAARWIKVLTPADLLGRLERDVLLPGNGPRDLPERQKTMTATVAWSYRLLDEEEKRAFRCLSVLPALFPVHAAAVVLWRRPGAPIAFDDALDLVTRLMDKSLLVLEPAVVRRPLFRMLETVRAYAAHQLTAAGEHSDAMEGLVRYCLDESATCAEGMLGLEQVDRLDRVHHDLDSYRRALEWLIVEGRAAEAADIVWRLTTFWMVRGLSAHGLFWCERILNLSSVPHDAQAKLVLTMAIMRYTRGQLERARTEMEAASALCRDSGDFTLLAAAELMLGHIEFAIGNVSTAREHFTRSLDMFRAAESPWGIGNSLTGLAGVALAIDDAAQAERLLDEATMVLRQAGPWYLTWALCWRAVLAVRRGDADVAIAFVRESLALIRELHDKNAFVYAMIPLAAAAVLKGDYDWAARSIGAGSIIAERTGALLLSQLLRDLQERAEREARAHLTTERWAAAYEAGGNSSIDALLDDIDRVEQAME